MNRRSALIILVIALGAVVTGLVLSVQRKQGSDTSAPTTTAVVATTESPTPTTGVTQSSIPPSAALAPACDPYRTVAVAGTLESVALVETSGIAASRTAPGVLWAHNDSGDDPRLYAIGPSGEDLGALQVAGGLAFDWEDLAVGPGPDTTESYLYVGDIGDNFGIRQGQVTVYLIREPDPAALPESVPLDRVVVLASPDGAADFEALFVADGMIFLATKDKQTTSVYQSSPLVDGSATASLELIATLDLGAEVTAADVSWDGTVIAFRGYEAVWMWNRAPGTSVADALATEPCTAPSPEERQGEALAFLADGSFVTVSEGTDVVLHLIRREP
jgi:hypothetical protein